MRQENVFRLEIAMDDPVLFKQQQTAQKLLGEAPHYVDREASEGVGLDELVQIHVQELGGDAKMATEIEALCKVDHAVFVLRVL